MSEESSALVLHALPEQLRGLLQASAYPHEVASVELIETQLSWVLLAGERTYKLKRPVLLPFVDQRRLADRRRLCQEEVRLNRRDEFDQLVLNKQISAAELIGFGHWLAHTQKSLPQWYGERGLGQPEAVVAAVARNAQECAAASAILGASDCVERLGELLAQEIGMRRTALSWRAQSACIRECHADLHLSNVVRIAGELPLDRRCSRYGVSLRRPAGLR